MTLNHFAQASGASRFAVRQFRYAVRARRRLARVEEFGNVIVRAGADGSFVRLRDVARIELGSQVYDAVSKLDTYEGERSFTTEGRSSHRHPIDEAADAMERLRNGAAAARVR